MSPWPVLGSVLLAGATATALTVGVTDNGPAGPITPRAALEAYFWAATRGDGDASWDLLCADEQRSQGPRDQYLRTMADLRSASDEDRFQMRISGLTVADPSAGGETVARLLYSSADGSAFYEWVLVTWERDGFRVCTVL
ncbi:hypothetical protein [Blastococcus sp. TF02A-26]|uniref:hypothetical protein n=1 Tax=Blastococcus sp. TF02A-26 TaxID=2250577 RepID=UPI0011BE1563|nr:hypothetical protein [Blastococcus sp. TF02A-26]